MRVRIGELMADRGLTPYALAKASEGRITEPRAYRLARAEGKFSSITSDVLEALCDVLGVSPGGLLERGADGRPAKRRKR